MTSLHVGITAHPKRQGWAEDLADQLGPPLVVTYDRRGDRWDTAYRAYRTAWESGADHCLIVQDDAILCDGILDACQNIAQVADGRPTSLYIGALRPNAKQIRAQVHDAPPGTLLVGPGPWWAVALLLPCDTLEKTVTYAARNRSPNVDHRLAAAYRHLRLDCLYAVPSLADHRRTDNPSLVKGRTGDRYAMRYIGTGPQPDVWTVGGPIKGG